MELFILIFTLVILAETTLLVIRNGKNPRSGSSQRRKVYVDTSALMDPRLVELAKTGFMSDSLLISRNVVHELQMLADGKDSEKRIRARAGLDAVSELERVVFVNAELLNDEVVRTPVDDLLLGLAKNNRGTLLTNDFNLKKVATAEHIDVLSINELALVLRNEFLPGERTTVRIIAEGSNPNQGVAYLRDGTMVVVDHASDQVGKEIEVEFLRLNQSAAGSMMFARVVNRPAKANAKNPPASPVAKVATAVTKKASSTTQKKATKKSASPKATPTKKANKTR